MIEVSKENIWYKRKKRFKRRIFTFFLILCILACLTLYYKFFITENIINICSDYAYSYSTQAVNNASITIFNNNVKYEDLVYVEKDSAGNITLISTNSVKINIINKQVTDLAKKNLHKSLDDGIPIPFMAFLGIDILSGYGASVKFRSLSVVSVTGDYEGKFASVGINQTLHSVYINVKTEVVIELPLNRQVRTCVTPILISESVLVGKVPEIYLKND